MKFAMMAVLVVGLCMLVVQPAWALDITSVGVPDASGSNSNEYLIRIDGQWWKTTSPWHERELRDARNHDRSVTVTGPQATGQNPGTVGNPHTVSTVRP